MEQLRIGVVGCGAIGRDHIRRINEVIQGARVTAVSDVFAECGKTAAAKWGAEFFADGGEMIRSDLVDAVIVATLDEFHEQYAVAAIRAGKYVFCEKPLAPDAASCRRIMRAEMDGGKPLLQVGFMRPPVWRAADVALRAPRDVRAPELCNQHAGQQLRGARNRRAALDAGRGLQKLSGRAA